MVDLKPHEYEANADWAPSATCASGKVQYPSFTGIYQIRRETDSVVICCDVMRSVAGAVATGSNSATVEIWLRLIRSLPLPVLTSLSNYDTIGRQIILLRFS